MNVIEIQCNGVTLAVAGASNASLFSVSVFATIEGQGAVVECRGILELSDDRRSHVDWIQMHEVQEGDVLRFCLFESETATAPVRQVVRTSPEHIASEAEYDEMLRAELAEPPPPRQLELIHPNAALRFAHSSGEQVTATLAGGMHHISFSVLWNKWELESCRVSLRSFAQDEALDDTTTKKWFRGRLSIGEHCTLTVGGER